MKNNILIEQCSKFGLPKPFLNETQLNYVLRLLIMGHRFHTRLARAIGIYNLHTLISILRRKRGIDLMLEKRIAKCPMTNQTPTHKVDYIWMTTEQMKKHKEGKRR